MNIISNTCIGSYIMRDCLKQQYNNPFCWNIIDANSMYNLIKYFDVINFDNWELSHNDEKIFTITIDNLVKVKYVHYHYSNETKITKNGVDIFYNKIWEYIVEKYCTRLKRMQKNNEVPTFIIGTSYPFDFYTIDEIKKIYEIDTPYKIYICNNKIELTETNNCKFIKSNLIKDNEKLAKDIYSEIIKF